MKIARSGSMALLFGSLALAGCNYTVGTASSSLPFDMTCTSDVLDQTLEFKEGETLYSFSTNTGEDYYGLTRDFTEVAQDKAITTTTKTEVAIKLYDHDRWKCKDAEGARVDYKSIPEP